MAFYGGILAPVGVVPKWLRERPAKPSFGGSNPPGASIFSMLPQGLASPPPSSLGLRAARLGFPECNGVPFLPAKGLVIGLGDGDLGINEGAQFGCTVPPVGWKCLPLGSQPLYTRDRLSPEARRQARRGLRHVVTSELEAPTVDDALRLESLRREWTRSHRGPQLDFLARSLPFDEMHERIWVADSGARWEAALAAQPLDDGVWLISDLVRRPDAPNGVAEALFCAAVDALPALTFGFTPLTHHGLSVDEWTAMRGLRMMGALAQPFIFSFDGLIRFRAKLGPVTWQPLYLAASGEAEMRQALWATTRAFLGR